MAADPERVAAFYDQLVPPLEAAARDEIGEMAPHARRDRRHR